jgi:hypothetical protein
MVQTVGGLFVMFGSMAAFASTVWLVTMDYITPPIPTGWVVGMTLMSLGTGITVGSSIIACKKHKDPGQYITIALLGATLIGFGIRESIILHPLELPDCPCKANYFGKDCTYCPSTTLGVCNGVGSCDDGDSGSGKCFCDTGWDGDQCEKCAISFEGEQCDTCKRNWQGDNCDICYPGYAGSLCDKCDVGWITESDVYGTLCRTCEAGRWGGYCKPCQNCSVHDSNAVCRDNVWHEANIYDPLACTAQGSVCSDKYDCGSNNCKGVCVIGDSTNNQVCEFDGECFPGTCEFKQCCLESRHGNGHCECGSIGYEGEDCRACPGFDGVYSATICTGHGTCVTEYAGGEYVGLSCACTKQGVEPFPAWTGDTCSCLKNSAVANSCSECATGSYGPQCLSCPGGSGIGQCNMHGKCSDGVGGAGTCSCDIDVKYGGLGAFKGDACESCLSSDFFGENCKTCPNLQVVQCIPGLNLTEIPGVGNCIQSCGANTCGADGICI